MNIEVLSTLHGAKRTLWLDFLAHAGLAPDEDLEQTVLVWDEDTLVATGSRQQNLLKCIAVDVSRQGEGILATVLTALRQEAFRQGHRHLFLYTKPENEYLFSSLFFYKIAKTDHVLLMEDRKNGIREFLDSLPAVKARGTVGAAVMNSNPFTLGHRYLIETAARECDRLYVFVLSEDKSRFCAADRLKMVELGTADLPNVTVLPTGPYLISSATFPTYFLKNRDQAGQAQCLLDIEIFTKYFAPKFSITRRYVGTEPGSVLTNRYNEALKAYLPSHGIAVLELPRMEHSGMPISASTVRKLLDAGDTESLRTLVPQTTWDYLHK